jgi:outer membrane protein TolC
MSWTTILGRLAIVGIVGGAGCVVGPDYHPAAANAPGAWVSPADDGVTNRAVTPSSWWASFNDVELDSLIQRAAAGW